MTDEAMLPKMHENGVVFAHASSELLSFEFILRHPCIAYRVYRIHLWNGCKEEFVDTVFESLLLSFHALILLLIVFSVAIEYQVCFSAAC